MINYRAAGNAWINGERRNKKKLRPDPHHNAPRSQRIYKSKTIIPEYALKKQR
jgi:hypothetical protein